MPNPTSCPNVEVLKAFALGGTAEIDAAAIETHLADCPACIAILEQSGVADPLVAAVRAAGTVDADSADRALVDRLQAGGRPADPAQTTDFSLRASTANHPPSVSDDDTEEGAAFLAPPVEPGEIGRLGPYRVLAPLGRGGMGMVFRAEDLGLRRPVALKVMRPRVATSAAAQRRFLAEAQAAAQLRHDHVVTIYQVGEDRGVPFLAMELLDGESLDDRLQKAGRLCAVEVSRIGRETAQALSAAHAIGLVHRDIKPANLWLDSASGRTKVLDFGLARPAASDAGVTASGVIVGTPAYMAPEQARGESLDGRADLFALGVTLYRAATGVAPFSGRDAVSTLLAITSETPATPRSICPEVPSELSAIIMQLLEKNPAKRPATASEVATKLANLERELSSASPAPPARRWPMIAAGFLAFVIVLAGITVIIRDKNGRKIAEVDVPEGGRIEVGPANAPAPRHAIQQTWREPDPAPQIRTVEPPPLAEWIKGRKVLTVAQNGTGQFKTIHAALLALSPGQVVKVLDKGPYRERLNFQPPDDTGLVSEHGTVIDLPTWASPVKSAKPIGQYFWMANGFRLSGFHFTAENATARDFPSHGLLFSNAKAFVLENCRIQFPEIRGGELDLVATSIIWPKDHDAKEYVIRECLFESPLQITGTNRSGNLLVTRNWFRGHGAHHIGLGGIGHDRLRIHQNVFAGGKADNPLKFAMGNGGSITRLDFTNNTMTDPGLLVVWRDVPNGEVIVQNNLRTLPGLFRIHDGAQEFIPRALANWQVGNNAYPRDVIPGEQGTAQSKGEIPPSIPADIRIAPTFLSDNPDHPDYLRLPVAHPLSKAGAGGWLPAYVGALPPGPAPKEGDWFTAMRLQWNDRTVAANPINIPEPPPLAEWLKGRDTVTVAQDGSGRFKTIQEALSAARPGQVVKVLDRATYRERLVLANVRDIGLVSENGATLELAAWVEQEVKIGHNFQELAGFRLHGFRIHYPNDDGRIGFRLTNCPGFVLENCYFSCATQIPIEGRLGTVISFDFDENYRSSIPQIIRGNRFGGCLSIHSRSETTRAIINRNYFTGRFDGAHVSLGGGQGDTVVVRDNVFDDMAFHGDIYVSDLGLKQLEISNNLLSGRTPIGFLDSISSARVVIRNNMHIRTYLAYLASGAEKALDRVKRQWQIDHNAYSETTTDFGWKVPMADVPKGAGDVLGPVKFLSEDAAHPDYLRLPPADARAKGGAGGAWPTYMGPLPPGPAPKEGDWFTTIRKKWTIR